MQVFDYGLTPPDVLSDERIAEVLPLLPLAEAWMDDVQKYAFALAMRGGTINGYKLVHGKKPARKWRSEEKAEEQLIRAGYSSDDYLVPRKLKSPAQIQKLIGASAYNSMMTDLTLQPEAPLTLAPDDDKRVGVNPADVDFADIVPNQDVKENKYGELQQENQ